HSFFFFFQAEDGIRDFHVTGVQTCALPICPRPPPRPPGQARTPGSSAVRNVPVARRRPREPRSRDLLCRTGSFGGSRGDDSAHRSEEHTSELQSRENLVCRLLLEKTKTLGI